PNPPPTTHTSPLSLHDALPISVLAHHAAAARRQGAVRRPALRRNGSLGTGSLRRSAHPAGTAHREVGRRLWPRQDLRGHRQGRTDRKSTRLNSSHVAISYAVFC